MRSAASLVKDSRRVLREQLKRSAALTSLRRSPGWNSPAEMASRNAEATDWESMLTTVLKSCAPHIEYEVYNPYTSINRWSQ